MSVIKTTGYSDSEIIKNIIKLYLKNDRFDLDPTYSKGNFYKNTGIKEPKIKGDLYPQTEDTIKINANYLEFPDSSIKSIIFDPPFLAGYTKNKTSGIIGNRFNGFRYMKDVWEFYDKALKEFYRVLDKNGVLAFKCQDTISSGRQYFSHCYIMQQAGKIGFVCEDLFVQIAKNRIIGHNHKKQKHARKFHSYWLVFIKK